MFVSLDVVVFLSCNKAAPIAQMCTQTSEHLYRHTSQQVALSARTAVHTLLVMAIVFCHPEKCASTLISHEHSPEEKKKTNVLVNTAKDGRLPPGQGTLTLTLTLALNPPFPRIKATYRGVDITAASTNLRI